jgi:hypothetical protein
MMRNIDGSATFRYLNNEFREMDFDFTYKETENG